MMINIPNIKELDPFIFFHLSLVVQEEACDDLGALTSLDHLHVVINTLLGSNFSVDQPRPTNQ